MSTTIHESVTTTPTIADVLERAADVVFAEWDWCQKAARRGGALCMLGAVAVAVGVDPLALGVAMDDIDPTLEAEYERASNALALVVPNLASWNDESGRTKAEVVQALRQAAVRAREAA